MNDPHVDALVYRISHRDDVDYAKAPPQVHDFGVFTIKLDKSEARVQMNSHFAFVDAARAIVEPVLKAWELDAALSVRPGELEFLYSHPEVIDRSPAPEDVQVLVGTSVIWYNDSFSVHFSRSNYPAPPCHIRVTEGVENMWHRYDMFSNGKTYLADAVNYCLTEIRKAGDNAKVRDTYGISATVNRKMGDLCSNKGGKEARKATAQADFSDQERVWLETALKSIIRRAAEVASDPRRKSPEITMKCLPPLG